MLSVFFAVRCKAAQLAQFKWVRWCLAWLATGTPRPDEYTPNCMAGQAAIVTDVWAIPGSMPTTSHMIGYTNQSSLEAVFVGESTLPGGGEMTKKLK